MATVVPHTPQTLSLSGVSPIPQQDRALFLTLLSSLLPKPWASIPENEIVLRVMRGGITNCLYCCHHYVGGEAVATRKSAEWIANGCKWNPLEDTDDNVIAAVMCRIYGLSTELFIDRPFEMELLLALSTPDGASVRQSERPPTVPGCTFGPPILGTFENGRFEHFLIGYSACSPEELRLHSQYIAYRFRDFHSITLSPKIYRGDCKEPTTWRRIQQWLELAQGIHWHDDKIHGVKDFLVIKQLRLQDVAAAVDRCKDAVSKIPGYTPTISLTHNDLLPLNVMIKKHSSTGSNVNNNHPIVKDVTFIDFEYCCFGVREFDIANHFVEWGGHDCRYDLYPSKDEQRQFFLYYLSQELEQGIISDFDAWFEGIYRAILYFSWLTKVFWAVWGVIQHRYSAVARASSSSEEERCFYLRYAKNNFEFAARLASDYDLATCRY